MRFSTKLSALFSAIFLIACLVISYVVYTSNLKTLEEQIRDRLEDQAFHLIDKIDRMLFERYADIKVLATDPVISSRSSTPKQIAERLIECQNKYKIYASLSFFDLNRVRIADTSGINIGKQNPFEDYWKDIAESKDSAIDIHKSVTLNRVVFHFVNLVKDKNGSAFGVVVSRMPVENLYDIVKKASGIHEVEETLKIDLLNKDGLILYSNYNTKGILKEISPDWEATRRFLAAEGKIGSERHYHEGEEDFYTFVREQGYLDFRGNDWTLIMHVPTKVVFAPAIELRNRTIMILVIIGVFALIFISLFSRTISGQLAKLSNASAEVAKGNFDIEVEIASKDEIGQLAAMFNKMTRDLQEYRDRLLVRSNELENANDALQAEIAQHKQAEEALYQSEERFRTAAQSATDLIYEWDILNGRLDWLGNIDEMLGYAPGGFPRTLKAWEEIIYPDDHDRVMTAVDRHLKTKDPYCEEYRLLRKDGTILYWTARGTALRNEKGTPYKWIGAITDITEHKQAEASLRESEERFRAITESTPDAIIVANSEGKTIFWNSSAKNILGYEEEEILGKPVQILLPEHSRDADRKGMEEFLETGSSPFIGSTRESIFLKKDGSEFPVEMYRLSLKMSGKSFIGAIIHDITERKQAEKDIKGTRDFLDNVFRTTQDGIVITDSKGYITRVNRAVEKMLGFTQEEIIGKYAFELSPQDDRHREIGIEFVTKIHENGFVKNLELNWLRKDGGVFSVELNVTVLKDSEGKTEGAVSVVRDITERKKAEEETRKNKDFLESVIESSKDGIVICDPKGDILFVNTALEKMSGFRREELIGEHASIFTITDSAMRKKFLEKAGELFEKGFTSFEVLFRTKQGKTIDTECNSSMIKDDKGNYVAGVSIIRDISERKKMEHQLIRSEKLKSLGELAGGVAHDFNNVLAAILGRAQLLRKLLDSVEGTPERMKPVHELKKGLELIEKASLDGAETVRRIQEFSRKKDERDDDTYFSEVDIHKMINDALEFTRARWKDKAESKGIEINIERELLPVPFILGSASELREVLTNIIHNAIDAMPKGGELRVKTNTENSSVSIKIEDSGIGIPEEVREKIFDPFFTTKGPQSTGLGMSVSYGIINRHQGNIKVDSVVGKGTTFTITLPVPEKSGHKEEQKEAESVVKESKKAAILVIEDEESVRDLLCDILVDGGHEVEVACNGSEGIELFNRKDFDLVFTDLGMPGISGWQVAEEIKKIKRETPVALITGWKVDQESEMMKNGVDLIVNKPFQLDQVLRLVHEGMEIGKRLGNN